MHYSPPFPSLFFCYDFCTNSCITGAALRRFYLDVLRRATLPLTIRSGCVRACAGSCRTTNSVSEGPAHCMASVPICYMNSAALTSLRLSWHSLLPEHISTTTHSPPGFSPVHVDSRVFACPHTHLPHTCFPCFCFPFRLWLNLFPHGATCPGLWYGYNSLIIVIVLTNTLCIYGVMHLTEYNLNLVYSSKISS